MISWLLKIFLISFFSNTHFKQNMSEIWIHPMGQIREEISEKEMKETISSIAQSCLTLYDPMNYSTPGPLSITISRSPPKPMSIESVMPSNHLILCHPAFFCPQSFPASGSFQMSQLFASGGQSTRVSASASVLPMNTQDWSPLGWTGWISLQSKGLSKVFSNTTVQKHQFSGTQLSL